MKRKPPPPAPMQLPLLDRLATRVVNIKREPGWKTDRRFVFIGRKKGVDPATIRPGDLGSFGNPFDVREHGAKALGMFETYARQRMQTEPAFLDAVRSLDRKILGCYCVRPDGAGACHGHIYLRLLDEFKRGIGP